MAAGTLMALLLAGGLWFGPGPELEWRRGALSRSFSAIREGFEKGEPTFIWLRRRLPLWLTWLVLTLLGYLHF